MRNSFLKIVIACNLLVTDIQAQLSRSAVDALWGSRIVPITSQRQQTWLSFYSTVDNPATGTGSVVLSNAPTINTLTVNNIRSTSGITLTALSASANPLSLKLNSDGVYWLGFKGFEGGDMTVYGSLAAPNSTAMNICAFGRGALLSNVSSPDNSAFGSVVLPNLINGSGRNNAFGKSALNNLVAGSKNVAIGNEALFNYLLSDNTAIGDLALHNATIGSGCIAVGSSALLNNVSATNLVGIGYFAGGSITTGSNNIVIGGNSLTGITTGSNNIVIGANISGITSTVTNNIIFSTNNVIRYRFDGAGHNFTGTVTAGSLISTDGNTLVRSGSVSQVGAATTVFTVTIGATQANTTYKVNVTPTNLLAAAVFYVTNKTTTTFEVTYISGLTGTVNFDWILAP